MLLESLLPTYDFREFHQTRVPAPANCVFRAIKEFTAGELPITRILMAIRLLRANLIRSGSLQVFGGRSLLEEFVALGFLILAEQRDREIVIGRIGQFWKLMGGESPRVADSAAFTSFERSGFAKVVTNFFVEGHQDGSSVVSTETRIAATDTSARWMFAAYWLMIRPWSALIRRELLCAIRRHAIELSSRL